MQIDDRVLEPAVQIEDANDDTADVVFIDRHRGSIQEPVADPPDVDHERAGIDRLELAP